MCNSLILLLLTLFCGIYADNSKNYTMSFEIRRQKTGFEQVLNHGHRIPHLQKYFQKNAPRDNDSIALYRFLDDEFYGEIVIGHPGQKILVNFDTSWGLSWIISSRCSSVMDVGCYFHNKYDHTKSSEYKKDGTPFFLDLGKYNMSGFYSYDNISMAHSNATNQSFVEIVHAPYEFIFNKADGVMGLGLKVDSYTPFFYTLLNQKKIKNPIFSIYLNRDKQSNRGGNVMLGFYDEKHIHKTKINNKIVLDNITYLGVEDSTYWQFKMDKVVVNVNSKETEEVVVCENGCEAIVDTSSNSIIGPEADIDQIHDAIKANEFVLHRYTLDCDTINKLPKIDFILNGKNFTLSGSDYTVKMAYHSVTVCLSAFVPANTNQEQNRWILGAAFLSEFYSIYNVNEKTIGFVKAN